MLCKPWRVNDEAHDTRMFKHKESPKGEINFFIENIISQTSARMWVATKLRVVDFAST